MIEKEIKIFECEFCGFQHTDKDYVEVHEQTCPDNPLNQPCSKCIHQILNFGCAKNVDMEKVGEKVKCFFYEEGSPANPFHILVDGNYDDFPEK